MPEASSYTVGWICAVRVEYVAALAFLDEKHDRPDHVVPNDSNVYTLGRVGKHHVVIGTLPDGDYGIAAAAAVAKGMLVSFPNVRIGMMVGIGGGAPSSQNDIRLGDIVVSATRNGRGGVFQFDFGKTIQSQEFQHIGLPNHPPELLRAAMADIRTEHEMEGHRLQEMIDTVLGQRLRLRSKYQRPHDSSDRLFRSEVVHHGNADCSIACYENPSSLIQRPSRTADEDNPAIHYGTIASSNQLMKDALIRDRLAAEEDVLCFEMEAAGLMNHFPCIVIRGICDYSDSHKNKQWQGYAAMVAAAYAKDLLSRIPLNRIEAEKRISDILSSMEDVQKDTLERVRRIEQDINTSSKRALYMEQDISLSKLRALEDAKYDSHANEHEPWCQYDTRVALLRQIDDWSDDQCGRCIYLLQGMAGTGKSTICRTVAGNLDRKGILGASFFFKRGEGDRGKAVRLFPSIAAQLARKYPAFARHVRKTIEDDDSIADKALHDQFEKLVLQPLKSIQAYENTPKTIMLVIDALDECDREEHVQLIISLLPRLKQLISPRVKCFITGRPEQSIRLEFDRITGEYQDLVLHQVDQHLVYGDILRFLETELSKIKNNYNRLVPRERHLPSDWPAQTNIHKLAEMAVPLFIFAATACRFIGDSRLASPDRQLAKILEYSTREISKLEATYSPVLDQLLVGLTEPAMCNVIRGFQDVVGSIIILAKPMSTTALSLLIGVDKADIDCKLDLLHSVLDIPPDEDAPVKLLHLSFRDFLLERKTHMFWVDEMTAHNKLATRCLELLMGSNHLEKDVCGLGTLGAPRGELSRQKIDSRLPPQVQYSCLYWAHHMKIGEVRLNDMHIAFQFLQRHFLHWLEVLSLLGRISESIELIEGLQLLINVDYTTTRVSRFLYDAKRFILNCSSAVDLAPLQLYSAALIFAPQKCLIRETFQDHIYWIKEKPITEQYWSSCLQTLEGHNSSVNSVAFSNDGKWFASGSTDCLVKVWDAVTGALQYTFKGHHGSVGSVAFASNNTQLASGSDDMTVKIWNVATGELQSTLGGHRENVQSIALTIDGGRLASGSNSGIEIWDVTMGVVQHKLNDHNNWATSLAFSDDGKLLASGSSDMTVKIWDATEGTLKYVFEGHDHLVTSVAFSIGGALLASGSLDKTVKVWDTATGALYCRLSHDSPVISIDFSNDGMWLMSGSEENTVKIWDMVNKALHSTLIDHDDLDGMLQASVEPQVELFIVLDACYSKGWRLALIRSSKINIWDTVTGLLPYTLSHTGKVTSAAFSRDARLLVSGSGNGSIQIWDLATGEIRCAVDGYYSVTDVTFSGGSTRFAAASDRVIKIWEVATGVLVSTLNGGLSGPVKSVAFSSNGNQLASGSVMVNIWDMVAGVFQCTLGEETDSAAAVEACDSLACFVAYSGNDRWLASSCLYDDTVKIWDVASWALHYTFRVNDSCLYSCAFSRDSERLALGESDGLVKIWGLATGELQCMLHGHNPDTFVSAIAFSSNSSQLALALADSTVQIWDMQTTLWERTLEGHDAIVNSVTFSTDGRRLVSGSGDATVKVWDMTVEASQYTLEGHDGPVGSIAFSRDERLLASGSGGGRDWTAKVWDTATGAIRHTLVGHQSWVTTLVFSTNGRWLASAEHLGDGVKIWDVESGALQRTLGGHAGGVTAITISGDNKLLASLLFDATIMLWDIPTGALRHTLNGYGGPRVNQLVMFSSDSRGLAAVTNDNTVKIWDVVTGMLQWKLEGQKESFFSFAFSAEGRLFISGYRDAIVNVWNEANAKLQYVLSVSSTPSSILFDSASLSILTKTGEIHLSTTGQTQDDHQWIKSRTAAQHQLALRALLEQFENLRGPSSSAGISWITWRGQRILWLPPEYRPAVLSISQSSEKIALGLRSGRVVVLGFADAGPHCVGTESQSGPNSPAKKETSSGQRAQNEAAAAMDADYAVGKKRPGSSGIESLKQDKKSTKPRRLP